MKRFILVLSSLVLLAAVDVPPARVTPTFLDTLEVRLTSLDVVVTDRQGAPVRGLKSSDFEVMDDGQPQEITNFSEDSANSGTARAASARQTGPAGHPAGTPASASSAPLHFLRRRHGAPPSGGEGHAAGRAGLPPGLDAQGGSGHDHHAGGERHPGARFQRQPR